MTAGVGVEFQGKTAASEEEEKHVQGTEVKVGLEEANKLHTEPPGWGAGRRCCEQGRKSISVAGWVGGQVMMGIETQEEDLTLLWENLLHNIFANNSGAYWLPKAEI